jgi:hypothetical protein
LNDNGSGGLLVFSFLVLAGIGWVLWAGSINHAWYSLLYKVSPTKILIDQKPIDCDFVSSPFGAKGCSYKASVSAFNAAGILVGGDRTPKYARSTEGKPIVSFDEGKSWQWFSGSGADLPDPKVDRVTVSWIKVRSN